MVSSFIIFINQNFYYCCLPQAAHLQMVKVSPNVLLRSISSNNKKRENESFEKFMSKITHLYMNNKNIDDVVC